jgi:hypothetical protein
MKTFHYDGLTKTGASVSGEKIADSTEDARSALKDSGVFVTMIKEGPRPGKKPSAGNGVFIGSAIVASAMLFIVVMCLGLPPEQIAPFFASVTTVVGAILSFVILIWFIISINEIRALLRKLAAEKSDAAS